MSGAYIHATGGIVQRKTEKLGSFAWWTSWLTIKLIPLLLIGGVK